MKNRISLIAGAFFLITSVISCKKSNDAPPPPTEFQAITFKFGADSTSINIDNATKVLKNMPRSCDVTQLGAAAVLPAGYSISPNPASAKDYSKGVTYTVTANNGSTYTVQITAPVYDAVSNPYGIYTAKHLNDIRKGLNDSYVLLNDIQLPDLSASNAAASVGISDYAEHGWFSIGAAYVNGGNVIFRGTLDGQNHIIKNYATNYRPSGNPNPAGIDPGQNGKSCDGIFGYATRATFKNIGIQLAPGGIKDFTPDNEGYGNVGSLVGLADSCTITNCFVTGNTIITGGQFTGGLIGRARYTTVNKCYAALTPASGNYAIAGSGETGGLIGGALYGEVRESYAAVPVIGAVNVGGLIGASNTTNFKACHASGNVAEMPFNNVGSLVASNNIGGLIGTVISIVPTTIQNCYAAGSVTGANGTNTSFHKGTRIGGLIGSASAVPVSVSFCYASGVVSRVWTSETVPYLIGGLVGTTSNGIFITSSVCTNYWDKTATGQNNLGGGNAALAQDNGFTTNGKTSAEMKTAGTFMNWDFSTVWNITAGKNNGYPHLRSTLN